MQSLGFRARNRFREQSFSGLEFHWFRLTGNQRQALGKTDSLATGSGSEKNKQLRLPA